ncbi:class I SAM-dependent methyltransferase [Patescibacteria group bacterium]|nr:class I SAM-dependent methyltransferase [Patescibacteria group bacterium]
MVNKKNKTITEWWKKFLQSCPFLISDWVKKETYWLKKNINKNSIVLDIGCGWGDDLKTIAKIIKSGIGVDNDLKAIKEAKNNLSCFKNIKLFFKDAKKLYFKDNTFDYVICLGNTFGNLEKDKHKVLKEMKRIVKDNGKIVISVYSEKALPARMEGYKKMVAPIKKITKEGTVYIKEGFISEQFSKKKIKKIFNLAKLKVDIQKLNPISYICIATKN